MHPPPQLSGSEGTEAGFEALLGMIEFAPRIAVSSDPDRTQMSPRIPVAPEHPITRPGLDEWEPD